MNRSIRVLGIIGPPQAGKDYIAEAVGYFFMEQLQDFRVIPVGRVLRSVYGERYFIHSSRPGAPPELDGAVEAMITYVLERHRMAVVVGVPRNLRQCRFIAAREALVVHVHGRWHRKQSAESEELAGLVSASNANNEVLNMLSALRVPVLDLWNHRQIAIPSVDEVRKNWVPIEELAFAIRHSLPSGTAHEDAQPDSPG